jgi:4-hydroxybenzoyl-CoA thioesterase
VGSLGFSLDSRFSPLSVIFLMKRFVSESRVEFADCDAAGIVFYPQFFVWFDRGTERLFTWQGLSYRALRENHDVVGLPLLESSASYRRPCRLGAPVRVESWIGVWHEKVFVVKHEVYCEDELAVEGQETRAWARPATSAGRSMRAAPIPESVRSLFD